MSSEPKIRTLVVDDSAIVRLMVNEVLSHIRDVQVVGIAPDGKVALEKIRELDPDIVLLDLEMPVMNGLEALAEMRKHKPQLPVIIVTSETERSAKLCLEALSLGARDYVFKPSRKEDMKAGRQRLQMQLEAKIREACSAETIEVARAERKPKAERPRVVAIGSSTGGPDALERVFSKLPATFPLPIVITQHMPPVFTRALAKRLDGKSGLTVREATGTETLKAGEAWVAPGGKHLIVRKHMNDYRLLLDDGEPENSCKPAVDVMFKSVVRTFGGATLAVVLTGMGEDGLRGCRLVRDAGGQVIVQDEETSVVWGMPGAVAQGGCADAVLPLKQIPEIILNVAFGGSLRTLRVLERSAT